MTALMCTSSEELSMKLLNASQDCRRTQLHCDRFCVGNEVAGKEVKRKIIIQNFYEKYDAITHISYKHLNENK